MSNNKQSMKLYTEDQVKSAIIDFVKNDYILNYPNLHKSINTLTPIELPSDEQIWDEGDKEDNNGKHYAFTRGATWMRDKIQGGNNEQ